LGASSQRNKPSEVPKKCSSSFSFKSGVGFALIGGIAGAVLGLALRPSYPLIGPLPIGVVITRGAGLQGFDRMLVPAAQESFNYFFVGLILGAVAGFLVYGFLAQLSGITGKQDGPFAVPFDRKPRERAHVHIGDSIEQVTVAIGEPESEYQVGDKVIYQYRNVKITFVEGRVSDVN
jgi:hypothetical protein